jgi:hypothetical protein
MAKEKESGKKKDAGPAAGKPAGKPAKQAKAAKTGKPEGGVAAPKGPKAPVEPARLRVKYRAEVVPALMKQFGYTNKMQVPKLVKVVLNRGTGDASSEAKVMETFVDELRAITGQRPVVTRARRSIAAFKLREGMPIGCKVTLRGERMYEFFDRLVSLTLPRGARLPRRRPRASTDAATSTSGSTSRSSSPRSSTTRSSGQGREHLDWHDRRDGRRGAGPAQGARIPLPRAGVAQDRRKGARTWRRHHSWSRRAGSPSSRCGNTTAAPSAGGRGRFCGSSRCAAFVSAPWPWGDIPVVKASW